MKNSVFTLEKPVDIEVLALACQRVSHDLSQEIGYETEIPAEWFTINDDGTVDLDELSTLVLEETDDYYVIHYCNHLYHLSKDIVYRINEYVREYLNE